VLVTAGIEIGRQIMIWIAVAVGALDPNLLAAELLAQGLQGADLVGDAVDTWAALGVALQHRVAPGRRYHAVQRYVLLCGVEAQLARGVAGDDVQSVEHGPMCLVVGAEVERFQHQRQHAPVVRAVGIVNDRLQMSAIDRPSGLAFGHKVMQGLLADGREDHVAHGTVRLGDAGRGQLEQQRRLASDALEVGNQFPLDALLGFRADAVHGGDEQVGEAVGDLALADVAEGGEQGQADRVGMPAQLM